MDADAVVIGGGPVGLTAALLLADGGARVTVVEPMTGPGDLPRAISIADESFRIIDGLGLADALKTETYLDTGARYFGRGDRLLAQSRPAPSRIGHPAKSQFDQPVLEQLLWDRAVEHPGIDFRRGEQATAITQDGAGVTVTTADEQGTRSRIRGTWLIGADGGRSFTRDALGVPLVGSTQEERWIVIDLLDTPGEREPFAEFHGNGERPYVLVPGIRGRLRLEYMMLPGDDAAEMTHPDRIRELVLPFHPEVRAEHIRRAAVYVAHRRLARTYRVGRAFLVGDAAHLMPPFSGQGLNAGLRDAANLSWKLLAVLAGRGGDRLLDSYELERRAHAEKMVRVSHLTGSVVMARGAAAILRDACFAVARLLPPVHAYLSGMRFITPPDHTGGVTVTPDAGVDKRLARMVGKSLSQPAVARPGGAPVPLDRVLAPGWALVVLGPDEPIGAEPFFADVQRIRLWPHTVELAPAGDLVDLSGSLADPDPAHGLAETHVLVVRPDRYVAAAFAATGEQRVVAELAAYLDLSQRQEARSA